MGKILAFGASNSSTSINQKLINAVAPLITENDVEVISLRDYPAPLFGVDLEKSDGYPDTVYALLHKIQEADGFLISTPEHNKTITAMFKNLIDWLSRLENKFFEDKPVALLSASNGKRGALWSREHLEKILPHRGANIVGGYSLSQFKEFYEDGKLADEKLEEIKPLIADLEKAVKESEKEGEKDN